MHADLQVFATIVIAYALSPFDLIPDFIPVVGILDDLILLPMGLYVVLKLIPDDVMADARTVAAEMERDNNSRLPPNYYAAAVVIGVWIVTTCWVVKLAWGIWHPATTETT